MSLFSRYRSAVWLLVPLVAGVGLVWTGMLRGQRVEYVSSLKAEDVKPDAASPTGYAGGIRRLVMPGHQEASRTWIAQTQQMFARQEWRVRHVDYDNAPFGRPVSQPSPYRWWFGLVAQADRLLTGRPLGQAVEHAALLVDPLVHLLLLASVAAFVAGRFGVWPAALVSLGLVSLYPLAGEYLPGLPTDQGLILAAMLWSVLPLLAGIEAHFRAAGAAAAKPSSPGNNPAPPCLWGWFFAAGLAGGFGLWVSVAGQVPILAGIALGALLAAGVERGGPQGPAPWPWRAWSLGGALATTAACFVEYFPDHLALSQLRVVHPLYAVAWLGGGEVLLFATDWIRCGKKAWSRRSLIAAATGLALLAALPLVLWKIHDRGFLAPDLLAVQLARLPEAVTAPNSWAWLRRDGFTPTFIAVTLPVLLLLPAGWVFLRRKDSLAARILIALAAGPVLVTAGFSGGYLAWWSALDAMLLVLLLATAVAWPRAPGSRSPWALTALVVALLVPGAWRLAPPPGPATRALAETEVQELVERDLAHWLARQAGVPVIAFAPLNETSSLHYYGGLRGLGTLDWENIDGVVAAIRLASATTATEALELLRRRGVSHIVMPSWDSQLDEFARAGLGQVEGSLIDQLNHWALPNWLRPMAYQLPSIPGMAGRSVAVFAVVDEQPDAVALSRVAEYFLEMDRLEQARATAQKLKRFPADLGALIARAQVELAGNETENFTATVEQLRTRLNGPAGRILPWDRRVSLAVVLARARQMEPARTQAQRCLQDADEARLRSLSPATLYRLLVLGKAFGLQISDPELRTLALGLLPPDLRQRL